MASDFSRGLPLVSDFKRLKVAIDQMGRRTNARRMDVARNQIMRGLGCAPPQRGDGAPAADMDIAFAHFLTFGASITKSASESKDCIALAAVDAFFNSTPN